MVNLKCLNLNVGIEESEVDLNPISVLTNLEELRLAFSSETTFITDECLINFSKNLKNLKKLKLLDCSRISDTGLYAITSLPTLEDVSVSSMSKITHAGFHTMVEKSLRKLVIKECKNIRNFGIQKVLASSKKLEYLSINQL